MTPCSLNSTRAGLTILELLAVILCCFILWGFLNSAGLSVMRNTRRRQAETDVQTLANAVLSYRHEYGYFPGQDGSWENDIVYLVEGGSISTRNLTKIAPENLYRALSNTNEIDNPRRILFLEDVPSRMIDDVFLDPWGDPYVVVVDANADGWVGDTDSDGSVVSSFKVTDEVVTGSSYRRMHTVPGLRESVYVFSWGNSHTNAVISARGGK